MSIFQKITNLLFDESDVDVIAEDELEDISLKEEEKQREKNKHKNHGEVHKEVVQASKPEGIEKQKEESYKEKVEEVKKAVRIDLEEEHSAKQQVQQPRRSTQASETKRLTKVEEKKEFEFTPVISPIFGSNDTGSGKNKTNGSVVLPKTKKHNPLGTVISPYYGLGELEEMEEAAKEDILRKAQELEIEDVVVPLEDESDVEFDETDINSISLDDLIMDNEIDEDEEDMMQISLFGDNTPIKESENENKKV